MLNFFDSVSCETIIAENEAYEQVLAMVRLHPGGPCPESHRRCVLAGVRDEGKVVVGERRWRKLDDARGPLGAAASRGCCGGVRTLGDREDVGSVRTLRDREDVGSVGTLGDREASEVFIPLGGGCPGIAGWS